ncbi:MAG: methionine gamma-lyase [Ectothiorhodospiraceae bacterium]|nr:methionine gamma-lyase [Ectothiorhodospiraceae bacterium]
MKSARSLKLASQVVHAGIKEDPSGSVVTPIYQTSTFKFRDADHGAALFSGEEDGYIYTRMSNPTIEAMEDCIATLEQGAKALGCASGMAAIHTVFAALTKNGDHVVCSDAVYGPTSTLLATVMTKFGVEVTFVDTSNIEAVKGAMRDTTKVVFVETPGNPTLVMSDLTAIAEIAHAGGALVAVDNTFMSPALQRPLTLGADVVVHSMTKFLNGHADVVAGVVVLKDAGLYSNFRKTLNQIGGVIDPFNSFLVHRGIKTLAIRMERHTENAMKIAVWLEKHPKIAWVRYPGLPSHPQYDIGRKQMDSPGGMIAFEMAGGLPAGKHVMNSVKLCQLAVSLGGVESLIQHPASMTHASMGKEAREQAHITDGLVRLSVGIEDADELIADLEQAFEGA